MFKFKEVWCLGDLHMSWRPISIFLDRVGIKNSLIVQVGDFGIGFDTLVNDFRRISVINEDLIKCNSHLWIIRGNHDNPHYFKNNYKFSNIEFLDDYSVRNINNENWLFIGGAISIDRLHRAKDKTWWEDEIFNFDESILNELPAIQRLVTHSSPDIAPPHAMGSVVDIYKFQDKSLVDELIEERKKITEVFNILSKKGRVKSNIYGHFHSSYNFNHNGTEFIGLNIEEFKLISRDSD